MKKTHSLTQNRAWNGPIDRYIKGFSFHIFENDIQHSRGEISRFFLQNLIFNHSDAKMSLEEEEARYSRIEMSKELIAQNLQEYIFHRRERV